MDGIGTNRCFPSFSFLKVGRGPQMSSYFNDIHNIFFVSPCGDILANSDPDRICHKTKVCRVIKPCICWNAQQYD